jgi:integrase
MIAAEMPMVCDNLFSSNAHCLLAPVVRIASYSAVAAMVNKKSKNDQGAMPANTKSKKSQGAKPTKTGQAPALPIKHWKLWLHWLLKTAGPRIYFVILLTGAFGLRCSEALALKREDVCLDADVPKIKISGATAGARKSPGDVYVRKQHLQLMRDHMKNGIKVERLRGHKHGKGKRKQIKKDDVFDVPLEGYIFKARKNAKDKHLHYHAVYDHVVRQAPKFYQHLRSIGEKVSDEVRRLRPHSGRATLITELMGEGLVTAMSMKYARHAPGSFKVHLGYSRLTLADVKSACDKLQSSRKKTKWTNWTTGDLLAAQKEINGELTVRLKK